MEVGARSSVEATMAIRALSAREIAQDDRRSELTTTETSAERTVGLTVRQLARVNAH